MITSLREQLQRDEGLRLRVYLDQYNHATVGYGHNLDAHGISEAIATAMLNEDILRATADVLSRIPTSRGMDEVRRGVLIAMAFNIGIGGLLGFKDLLAAIEQQDWPAAAKAILDSRYARQVGERAHRLADQMTSG